MDPAVREGGDLGQPVTISKPQSPVSLALREITENVAARISVAAVRKCYPDQHHWLG
jgi:MinD-like ATPase involved in chromosome partitioning or flagellar assembly